MNTAAAITLRPYQPEDAPRLAEIYRESVRNLGREAYTPGQIEAWARHPEDLSIFGRSLSEGVTLCALADATPVAFAQLHPADHIALTYCASAYARQGIMSRLYHALEEEALRAGSSHLHTEASLIGRPFFARMGFHVVEVEYVERHGVVFERYRMQKQIGSSHAH